MKLRYSPEAMSRISQLGHHDIVEFIEEVSPASRRDIYKHLGRVPGFRSGSPADFKERQKRLVAHILSSPAGHDPKDWAVFGMLWSTWISERFEVDIPHTDKSGNFFENAPSYLTFVSESFPNIPRESVERMMTFSRFPEEIHSLKELTLFRTASTIARDSLLDELPLSIKSLEQRIAAIEASASDGQENLKQINTSPVLVEQRIESVAKKFDDQNQLTEMLKLEVDKLAYAMLEIEQRVQQLGNTLEQIKGLKEDTLAPNTSTHATDQSIIDILDRMDSIQRVFDAESNTSNARVLPNLVMKDFQGPFEDLHNVQDVCELIVTNLQAVGVVKGCAFPMSRQIVAALVSGQLIQFSGSLAELISESIVAAVSGPIFHEWRVPVGLVSDECAAYCIEMVGKKSNSLLLKSANLSAFEVYGASIREIIVKRQFGFDGNRNYSFFTSWVSGPAAFPDGGSLAELGPVFDTDALRMRSAKAATPSLRFGRLAKENWYQLEGFEAPDPDVISTELTEFLTDINFEGGAFWRRLVKSSYTHLRVIPSASCSEDLKAISDLYLLPWARARGESVKEIGERVVSYLEHLQQ